MGNLLRGERRLLDGSTFSFVSGARQTAQLPVPTDFIKRLWLWVRGTLTISGVTVPGTVHTDGPANLIQTVELLVDGFPLKVGSGPAFMRIANMYDMTDGVNNGLISAGAGVYQFEAMVPLIFEQPLSVSPFDTILIGNQIRNLVLNLTWGTTASLVFGNTSTLAITATTVQVYSETTKPFALKGPRPWLLREAETQLLNVLTSSGTRLLMPFNEGSVYRAIQLRAIDGSDLSDAVINTINFRINGGQEIPFNTIEDDFMQAYDLYHFGANVMADGYYHVELAEGGRILTTGLGAGVKPNQINAIEFILDTTVGAGATSIVAHTVELMQPKAA
jgi:hypothetical protein